MFSKNIKIKKTPVPGPVSSCPDQPIKNSLPGWQERRPKFLSYDFTPFEPEHVSFKFILLIKELACFFYLLEFITYCVICQHNICQKKKRLGSLITVRVY